MVELPEVPRAHFAACVAVLNELETDHGKAALLSGLVGYFLSCVPWQQERVWAEAIARLSIEAAAVARNAETAGNDE